MASLKCSLVLLVCVASIAAVTSKTLILSGGYLSNSNSEFWNRFIALAGGRGEAKIGILTSASGTPISTGREYKSVIESFGAEAYWIPIHEGNKGAATDPAIVKKIADVTGFFFAGGMQQKYIQNLLDENRQATPAFKQIANMYGNGTVVAGSSAGAMVMPKVFTVVDGTSHGALTNGAFKVGDSTFPSDLVYDSEGGLGFLDRHIVDSHFHERGRQARMVRLLSDTKSQEKGTPYGIGIDEDTALIITDVGGPNEKGEVIGNAGGVMYIDTSKSYVDTSASNFRILNVFAHYMTAGDKIDLTTGTPMFSENKKPLKGNETRDYASTSEEIFAQTGTGQASEYKRCADSLFNSRFDSITYGSTSNDDPVFYVIMTEDSQSSGYYEIDGSVTKYAYMNLKLEMRASPADDGIY